MKRYDPKSIEPKWQQVWADTKLYAAQDDDPRDKYYYLVEFPYPSGDGLHVGHVLSYTALDIMARHKRMQGFNVLYPMGFDEFGLPTENYAIKHKIAPQLATERNVANFRRQMKMLGLSFDWDREVRTSDPSYYKWTQWIFLQLYKKGLAYQAEIPINWCPFEKTGLANEEVVDGKHERCGTPVERKLLKQWVLKITAYADRLAADLKTVDYLDRIASQQINWIGRSEGAEITWKLQGITGQPDDQHSVTVYTTRPDTLFGATFLVVSPEVANKWLEVGWKAAEPVRAYIKKSLNETELARLEDRTKTGVDTGIKAVHPLTGEPVPVWVADYVLGSYGTGAIMAVPAHDDRDGEFARTFDLPIKQVVMPQVFDKDHPHRAGKPDTERVITMSVVKHPHEDQFISLRYTDRPWKTLVTGGVEDGEDIVESAQREITEETGYHNLKFVKRLPYVIQSNFYAEHKDVNRRVQVHVLMFELENLDQIDTKREAHEKFDVVWTDFNDMPKLWPISELDHITTWVNHGDRIYTGYGPLINSGQFDGLEGTPAKHAIVKALTDAGAGKGATKYKLRDWIFSRQHYWGEPIPIVHCPTDGAVPVPEKDLPVTLPEVEHYEPTDTGESPLAAIPEFVNTTCPKCGGPAKRETDTMPNWAGSSWYFLRYTDPHNDKQFASPENLKYWTPVDLYNGGMEHTTLHLLYSRFWHKFLYDQGLVPTPEPYAKRTSHGMILGPDGQKMSKSKGNVINPDHVVEKYGADTIRLYEMFMGPFDEAKSWSEDHLAGVSRFLYRAWTLAQDLTEAHHHTPGAPLGPSQENTGALVTAVDRKTHQTIKKVHDHIGSMSFNLMVSALMEYINFLSEPKTKAALLEPRYAALAWRTLRSLILMLAPSAPHLAEELWEQTGGQGSVHVAAWPAYDPELIKEDIITVVVQINGKVRANLALPADASDDDLTSAAHADPKVIEHLKNHTVVKTIIVPRKLVNFVAKPSAQ